MASAQDTANRKAGISQDLMANNHAIAMAQGEKTSFRAHKVALSADPFNPNRLTSSNGSGKYNQLDT